MIHFLDLLLRLHFLNKLIQEKKSVSELVLSIFIPLAWVIVFQLQRSLYNEPNRDKVPNIYKRKLENEKYFYFSHGVVKC